MDIISVTGNFGYTQYRDSHLFDTHIDASNASWIVSNIGGSTNRYPFIVTDSDQIVLSGGEIEGEVSLTLDWSTAYINSAAVFARDSDDVHFENWRISQAWDGIRITGHDEAEFEISSVWMSNIRDDGVENDRGLTGVIRDTMMDGVFVGISLYESGTGDQTDQTVTLENVLIRMESFLYNGEMTHQPFFKYEDGVSPKLSLHNSVFAIDKVDHRELGRLADAWDNVIDASNNYFLNLTDDPLPSAYPLPTSGFTILEGAEARSFWDNARAEFIADFDGQMPEDVQGPNGVTGSDEEFVTKIFDVFEWKEAGGANEANASVSDGVLPWIDAPEIDNTLPLSEPEFVPPAVDFQIDVEDALFDFI